MYIRIKELGDLYLDYTHTHTHIHVSPEWWVSSTSLEFSIGWVVLIYVFN